MIAHIPLFAHKEGPRSVLIVGGGDLMVLREVVRHSTVENVVLCEIDSRVVALCREHLASHITEEVFRDSRVEIVCADASVFIKGRRNEYDVIIVDSSGTMRGRQWTRWSHLSSRHLDSHTHR